MSRIDRLRLRGFELLWSLGWVMLAGTFRDTAGTFLCGLVCAWSLLEVERFMEAAG